MELLWALLASVFLLADHDDKEPVRSQTCTVPDRQHQLFVYAETFGQVEAFTEIHEGVELYAYCILSVYESNSRVESRGFLRSVVVQCDSTWENQMSEINKCNTDACRLPPMLLRKYSPYRREGQYLTKGQTTTVVCRDGQQYNLTCRGYNRISNLDAVQCRIPSSSPRTLPLHRRPLSRYHERMPRLRTVRYPYSGINGGNEDHTRSRPSSLTRESNRDQPEANRDSDVKLTEIRTHQRARNQSSFHRFQSCELPEELKNKGIRLLHGTEVVEILKTPLGSEIACPPNHRVNYVNGFAKFECEVPSDGRDRAVIFKKSLHRRPTGFVLSNPHHEMKTPICVPMSDDLSK